MRKPNLIVFASGSKDGGGSGFQKLVEASRCSILNANITGVVSNHENGGVKRRADALGIRFFYSPKGRTGFDYRLLFNMADADFAALSGWLGHVKGLDPRVTFNIHPAYLPSPFGGKGMYGHHVHEAVIAAYRAGTTRYAGVSMHFVTSEYDNDKTVFFRRKVEILPTDDAETLAQRVNKVEHEWQAVMTNLVCSGKIAWDGYDPSTITGKDLDE